MARTDYHVYNFIKQKRAHVQSVVQSMNCQTKVAICSDLSENHALKDTESKKLMKKSKN